MRKVILVIMTIVSIYSSAFDATQNMSDIVLVNTSEFKINTTFKVINSSERDMNFNEKEVALSVFKADFIISSEVVGNYAFLYINDVNENTERIAVNKNDDGVYVVNHNELNRAFKALLTFIPHPDR